MNAESISTQPNPNTFKGRLSGSAVPPLEDSSSYSQTEAWDDDNDAHEGRSLMQIIKQPRYALGMIAVVGLGALIARKYMSVPRVLKNVLDEKKGEKSSARRSSRRKNKINKE